LLGAPVGHMWGVHLEELEVVRDVAEGVAQTRRDAEGSAADDRLVPFAVADEGRPARQNEAEVKIAGVGVRLDSTGAAHSDDRGGDEPVGCADISRLETGGAARSPRRSRRLAGTTTSKGFKIPLDTTRTIPIGFFSEAALSGPFTIDIQGLSDPIGQDQNGNDIANGAATIAIDEASGGRSTMPPRTRARTRAATVDPSARASSLLASAAPSRPGRRAADRCPRTDRAACAR
jgi:hypothetical protein